MEELSSNLCVWRSYHPTYFFLSARSRAEKPSDPPFKTPFSSTSFLPNPSKILKSGPPPSSSSGRLHVSAVPLSMAVKECKVKYMISASVLLITREEGLEHYQDMVLGRPFDTMFIRIYYNEDIAGFETVVFVVDNNLWAIGMLLLRATSDPEIWKKRLPFGMPEAHVDGMGVLKVREVAKEAVAGVLCRTYWFRGHSLADPDKLRPDVMKLLQGLGGIGKKTLQADIEISMGPDGELWYPISGRNMEKTALLGVVGVGDLFIHDKHMLMYVPEFERAFALDGFLATEFYSDVLISHVDKLIQIANDQFSCTSLNLTARLVVVHFKFPMRVWCEMMAGYKNMRGIIQVFKKHKFGVCIPGFDCSEGDLKIESTMRHRTWIRKLIAAAVEFEVPMVGENVLGGYHKPYFEEILKISKVCKDCSKKPLGFNFVADGFRP